MPDLFNQDEESDVQPQVIDHGQGVFHIKHLAPSQLFRLLVDHVTACAPLRQMMTPMGHPMKVSNTNCGQYGWVSDRSGYRYCAIDPISKRPWPCIPAEFLQLHKYACELVGLPVFTPDACLINHYKIGHSMGKHQDKDEINCNWPIVSISIGLSAEFQIFGPQRNIHTPALNILMEDGDVIVLSGASRHFYHGVKPIKPDLLNPQLLDRINLTLRKSH